MGSTSPTVPRESKTLNTIPAGSIPDGFCKGTSRNIAALRAKKVRAPSVATVSMVRSLGRVDGFDDDEAQSECDEGSEVLVGFLATERNALEALELADELLDAGAGAIERLREESRPGLGRVLADDLNGITGQMLRSRAAERLALAS